MADLKLLQAGATELGIGLTRKQLTAFSFYMSELLKWNRRSNLTAITTPEGVQTKHFLDSLTCALAFPGAGTPGGGDPVAQLREGADLTCMDIGTGAGFPGIPLKILLPELQLVMVDSAGKKATFVSHVVKSLRLDDTTVLSARAEDLAQTHEHRERYEVVISRALSRMPVVAELCLPLCHVGGRVIALKKGEHLRAELGEGAFAVGELGGRYGEPVPVRLSLLEEGRLLVTIEKVSPTPARYPRRAGIPGKRPLVAPA